MSVIHALAGPMFQSTHPHGVRLERLPPKCSSGLFQSTHPHGVRHIELVFRTSIYGFNPRTHTGCDLSRRTCIASTSKFQSTHPHGVRPIKSAFWIICFRVSIHAPTRGATYLKIVEAYNNLCFNPRTHTGCDRSNPKIIRGGKDVSIHAPTRGATLNDFLLSLVLQFQSTHPHGVRPAFIILLFILKECFNPRTHTGCDD